jgi:hypothetical protein
MLGMSYLDEQISDQRDSDLNSNGVLDGAEEVPDLQRLFDPAEEQLDRPAALVKIGDLAGGSIEIVADDTNLLSGLQQHAGLAHRLVHRISTAAGETLRQLSHPVGKDVGALRYFQFLDDAQRRVRLQPRDEAAAGFVQRSPELIM